MNLTDEQKTTIASWVKEGMGLPDIQRKLAEEFSLTLTFMETRFLVDDLDLDLVENTPPAPPENADGNASPVAADAELIDEGGPTGTVSVELDRLMQPGSIVSGSVTFSDGKTSTWALDSAGRLMLRAIQEGYQPSPADLESFQLELSRQLERQGY